ncbi:uncharacterized protein LOC143610063 [Bidens hawaiensis]|uniref:uncharacterized protein LOC143610063 n=1 Tax=Bidens hawaiensis TaxID=980011 RepID=UPI0040498C69
MDRKSSAVLDISSDEEGSGGNWLNELLGDDSDEVVVVVKESEKKKKVKVVDDDDECVVLDKDPNADVEVKKDDTGGGGGGGGDEDEIVVVGEKGQVACRDYPHSRHLCIKFPFSTTPNQSHCNQCYCYVCDSLAPCAYWGTGSSSIDHCHATDKDQFWVLERKKARSGTKTVQPASQPPPVNLYIPPPVINQPVFQIPKPGPGNHHRNQLHPGLLSRFVNQTQQKYNQNSTLHRPVFKRTHPLRAATVGQQNRYSSYRSNVGNPIRQNSYPVNGMLSGSSNYVGSVQQPNAVNASVPCPPRSSKYVGSLQQPNAVNASVPYPPRSSNYVGSVQQLNVVNASVPYPPQSQTFTPLTANQPQHQPQFSSQLNPSFQSHVNSNLHYQPPVFPPPSSQPQPVCSQFTYTVPVPVQPKTQVDSPLVQVSDATQNISQANQSQGPIVGLGFKDYGMGLPTGQDSSGGAVSSGLYDYRFDWMFDNQPLDPGFTDYSSDSAFIDTGPIFQF